MTKQASNTVVNDTTAALDSAIQTARMNVAEAVTRAYGAEREYAILLNQKFAFDWFAVEHRDVSDNAKALAPEKKAFLLVLNAAQHTNPSTVWARVRKYAKAERYPEPEKTEGDEVTEGEQGESGKANAERSPMLRNVEELTTLYKFNMRQENLPQKIIDANAYIIKALEALGVSINLIK